MHLIPFTPPLTTIIFIHFHPTSPNNATHNPIQIPFITFSLHSQRHRQTHPSNTKLHQMGNKNSHHHEHEHQQQLEMFWSSQREEMEQANDFKNHPLPLARIRKMMKADGDVHMISTEVPVVFAKACELFIRELTLRSWHRAQKKKRLILLGKDITSSLESLSKVWHDIAYFKRLMS